MRSGTIALGALLLILGSNLADAANWPRFRGPNGTGIAADKDIPVEWTDKNILWKVAIPGVGNSSPVVWGEKLFVQSSSNDGKERYLHCVNTADGKILWSKSTPAVPHGTHAKNTLASSTPATDGERVYCYVWDGKDVGVSAHDFAGTPLWQRNLGEWKSQHGAGASPMIFEDKVIVLNDMDGKSELIALEAKTGQPAWQDAPKPYRACYSTPFLLEKGAMPELIVATTAGVTSYNPKTGSQNWNWNWKFSSKMPLRVVSSPIYSQGLVFATSGDGAGDRHAVAIKADGKGDMSKNGLAWEEKKAFPYVPTMLAVGDHLYWVSDRPANAACVVAKTGKVVWSERLPMSAEVAASPVLIDGKVYAIDQAGTVCVFAATKTWKLLAKNSIPEAVYSTPAVADNHLYIRGRNNLYCIGKAK